MNTRENLLLFLNFISHDNPRRLREWILRFKDTDIEECRRVLLNPDSGTVSGVRDLPHFRQRIDAFRLSSYKTRLEKCGIGTLYFHSSEYPELLKTIPDAPPVLFYKGDKTVLRRPILAVVGPRYCSPYGKQAADHLVPQLLPYFCLASGLAIGMDTIVHHLTLKNGHPSLAVVATGLDTVYPPSNVQLAKAITEKGLLLSENPPGTDPIGYRFPQRNRLLSGISKGVLVIEAGEKSGSLITAHYGIEQNREVFAVPGPIFSEKTKGTHHLIQEGAKLVHNVEDILEEFSLLIKSSSHSAAKDARLPDAVSTYSQDELRILHALSETPEPVDRLVQKTGYSVSELLQHLTLLELRNEIECLPGHYFRKCFHK